MSAEHRKQTTYLELIKWVEAERKWASGKVVHHGSAVNLAEGIARAAGLTEQEIDAALHIGEHRAVQRKKEGRTSIWDWDWDYQMQ